MKEDRGKGKGIKRIFFLIISSVLVFLLAWLTGRFDSFNIIGLNELTILALKGLSIIGFFVGASLWLTFCRLCSECESIWVCNFDFRVEDE